MTRRDLEADDITAIYELHAKIGVARINETPDELMPQLIAVNMDDEPGRIGSLMMIDPTIINALQRTYRTKDMLMALVRLLLSSGDASPDAVVHVSEAWALSTTTGRDDHLDGYAEVKDHPYRTEALVVNVHTHARTYSGVCPINSDGAGNRRAVFKPLDMSVTGTGRLILEPEAKVKH